MSPTEQGISAVSGTQSAAMREDAAKRYAQKKAKEDREVTQIQSYITFDTGKLYASASEIYTWYDYLYDGFSGEREDTDYYEYDEAFKDGITATYVTIETGIEEAALTVKAIGSNKYVLTTVECMCEVVLPSEAASSFVKGPLMRITKGLVKEALEKAIPYYGQVDAVITAGLLANCIIETLPKK